MALKSPNEFWLSYLLAFTNMSNEEIKEISVSYRYRRPQEEYIDTLRSRLLNKPADTKLENMLVWARSKKIFTIATSDPDVIKAKELLGYDKLRKVLEYLIMSGASDFEVKGWFTTLTSKEIDTRVVKFFRHYFWNRSVLNYEEWVEYLDERKDKWILLQIYNNGLDYALWKLGYRIEIDPKDIVDLTLHEATMRFLETSSFANGRDTAMTAKFWSEIIFRALEEKNRADENMKTIIEDLRNISIKLNRNEFKSIKELEKGDDI